MAEVGSAFVSILPSARGFGRKLDSEIGGEVDKSGKESGKRFGTAMKAGLAIGGAAAGTFLKSVVGDSSDAQQSLGATESIFKQFSKTVVDSSKAAAKGYGLSANQYRESANLIGSLFKNQGVSMDQLAGQTDKMIGRASDLAAMFGGTTAEAVESLGSAFKGEFNPLEKYGITLNQTAINAELAARGQDKLGGSALAAAKQQATMDLIMRQSADSAGTFAKESNTLAGQQQRLGAEWGNLKVRIGNAFLPVATRAIVAIREMGSSLAPLGASLKSVGGFFAENKVAVGAFVGIIGTVVLATKAWAAAQALLNIALTANPIGIVVVAVAALVAGIIYAYQHFEGFRNVVNTVGTLLAATFQPILQAIGDAYREHIAPAVSQVISGFREWMPVIQQVGGFVLNLQAKLLGFYASVLGKVLPILGSFYAFMIGNVVRAISTVIGWLANIVGALGRAGAAILSVAQKAGEFVSALRARFREAVSLVGELPSRMLNALGDLGSLFYNKGSSLVSGLIDGIRDRTPDLGGAIGGLAGLAAQYFPSSPIKRGPLKSWNNGGAGKRLIDQGLIAGLKKSRDQLAKEVEKVAQQLANLQKNTADLQKTTADRFRNDAFSGNATVAGALRSLQADTTAANAHKSAAYRARKLGLDGEVYRQLLASGNTALLRDVNTKAEVRQLEAAWRARNKATMNFTTGAFGKPGGVADTIPELNQLIKEMRAELKVLGTRVEKGARDGTDKTRKADAAKRNKTAARTR